jgi:protein-S-isoprenylcysteine O-methyltransferase Ste14
MKSDHIISLLPLISVCCFMGSIAIRSHLHRRRGIRAHVRDPQLSPIAKNVEVLRDFMFWFFVWMVVLCSWSPLRNLLPNWIAYQLIDSPIARLIGAVCVVIPIIVYPITLAEMGNSWRMGIDRPAHDPATAATDPHSSTLITHGLYCFARNPIYVIIDLLFFGTFLILGQYVFLFCAVAFPVLIHLQILREEKFLTERYGSEYEAYQRRVRRYGVL